MLFLEVFWSRGPPEQMWIVSAGLKTQQQIWGNNNISPGAKREKLIHIFQAHIPISAVSLN